jgi:hypothetical protein
MHRPPPSLPPTKTLIRFFSERAPLSVGEVAVLVGFSRAWVQRKAADEGVDLSCDTIAWDDAMLWFLRAWPLTVIEDALPPNARGLLPRSLRTQPVTWRLPRYLVQALGVQVGIEAARARDAHDLSVEQFVSETLHAVIDDETVAELHGDAEFRDAFFFPEEPDAL